MTSHRRKADNMKHYLAIIPEEGHLNPDHEIRLRLSAHIHETNCHYCISFLEWHLDERYRRFKKKPRIPSCPVAIAIVKSFLTKERRQHKAVI